MTAGEVRATVIAYYRIQGALQHGPPRALGARLRDLLAEMEETLGEVSATSQAGRWAQRQVGPVLAAALGAAASMREEVSNAGAALRIYGLAGERPLTSAQAWTLLRPYCYEPTLSPATLAELRRQTGLRFTRLGDDPSTIDVLEELTRPRSSTFAVQVSRWLADYFRQHEEGIYPAAYRKHLADLQRRNAAGELAIFTGAKAAHGKLTRQDWEDLLHNRVPQPRMEMQAAYMAVREFIADYWQAWHPAATLAAG